MGEEAPSGALASPGESPRPSTREKLYRGVSHDGQGRAQYLRLRKKYGVTERYETPQTMTHDYGSGTDKFQYSASVNCRKPIIQSSFLSSHGRADAQGSARLRTA